MFCLVVDDFGVRYKSQADADHLIHTLEKYEYKLKLRPLGDVYVGMAISFDRSNKTVSVSMPGYVRKMLQRFLNDLAQHWVFLVRIAILVHACID
jgi:hypothetical protein